jgi:hypothetical protein
MLFGQRARVGAISLPLVGLWRAVCAGLFLGLSTFGAGAVAHGQTPVDLELVLAVDVSWSMDHDEQTLQRQGYVAGFRHEEVIRAIETGGWGRIAVTYVEWAGVDMHLIVLPWTLIDGAETAEAFAAALEVAPISRMRRTSISSALSFSAGLFGQSEFEGVRRVIDVSGDGANNAGPPVVPVRDELVAQGIVINGLPIMIKETNPSGFFDLPDLDIYYEDCVIGGTGAFIVTVTESGHFAVAIRRKLVLEIAEQSAPVLPVQWQQPEPRIDCLAGERYWERWRRINEFSR